MKNIAFVFFFILLLFSCRKENLLPPEGYESVILKDLTGLDACGLVFLQKDKTFLEPTNINAFGIKLERENEYWIKFEKDNLHGSFCMVGDVINLLELKIPYKY